MAGRVEGSSGPGGGGSRGPFLAAQHTQQTTCLPPNFISTYNLRIWKQGLVVCN